MDLFTWAKLNPGEVGSELPTTVKPIAVPQPPTPPVERLFKPGQVVTIEGVRLAGVVIGYNEAGLLLVNIGESVTPYPCDQARATLYEGVLSLYRLGHAVKCDRADCTQRQSGKPFTCHCGQRSKSSWWYVGTMSAEHPPKKPRWPDAVWYPGGYDPNTETWRDERS